MPLCEGVRGQPCPGEKSGFPIEVNGEMLLLCRVCYAAVRPTASSDDNVRISLSDTLTLTPARLTLGLDDTLGSQLAQQGSQPLFVTQTDEVMDIEEFPSSGPSTESTATTASTDNAGNSGRNTGATQYVVVNELLCYCTNMLNCMAQSMLQKVCAEYYDELAIDAAKEEILIHNMNEAMRNRLMKKRRGSDKKLTTMKDILDTIRSNNPDVFPVYVAKNLGNMPPLTKNCVNMASIMVELAQLRSDVNAVTRMDNSLRDLTEVVLSISQRLTELSAHQSVTETVKVSNSLQHESLSHREPAPSTVLADQTSSSRRQEESSSPTGVPSSRQHNEPSSPAGLSASCLPNEPSSPTGLSAPRQRHEPLLSNGLADINNSMSPQHREPALPSDSPNGVNNDQSKGRESSAGSRTRCKRDPLIMLLGLLEKYRR